MGNKGNRGAAQEFGAGWRGFCGVIVLGRGVGGKGAQESSGNRLKRSSEARISTNSQSRGAQGLGFSGGGSWKRFGAVKGGKAVGFTHSSCR